MHQSTTVTVRSCSLRSVGFGAKCQRRRRAYRQLVCSPFIDHPIDDWVIFSERVSLRLRWISRARTHARSRYVAVVIVIVVSGSLIATERTYSLGSVFRMQALKYLGYDEIPDETNSDCLRRSLCTRASNATCSTTSCNYDANVSDRIEIIRRISHKLRGWWNETLVKAIRYFDRMLANFKPVMNPEFVSFYQR